MLIKITALTLTYDSRFDNVDKAGYVSDYDTETWINPERVTSVEIKMRYHGWSQVSIGKIQYYVSEDDARRIIDHINQTPAPAAPAPAPAPKTMSVLLYSMTRDETKNSRSPFWRCGTSEGFTVNVFKHDDPLKDNFKLFDAAGYAPEMLAMNYGDTVTWTRDSIGVDLVQNGSFWNVTAVTARPVGARPDEPEPDDDDTPEPENAE